jgi:hypothetical protein
MTENAENLVLEHLRAIRATQDYHSQKLQDIKLRLSSIERSQARSHADYAELYGDHARQQATIDRLNDRLGRVERRLELQDKT